MSDRPAQSRSTSRARRPTRLRTPLALGLLCLGLLVVPPAAADDGDRTSPTLAGGRLIWDASDELDLLGDVWARLPLAPAGRPGAYVSLAVRTAIDRSVGDLTFGVRDVDYHLDAGYRDPRGWFAGLPVQLFVGRRGKLAVDARGDAWVRYVGLGIESANFSRCGIDDDGAPGGLTWRVAAGPVVDHRQVSADLFLRGEVGIYSRKLRVGRTGVFGIESRVDALIDDGSFLGDVAVGPAYALTVAGGRRALFFAQYQRSRNPLGIGHSALLVGFEYAEGAHGAGPRPRPPDVRGLLGAGGGDAGRVTGEALLEVLSPPFGPGLRVAFSVDANLVTGEDANELFYLYHLGLERPLRAGVAGAYFYHRSNHVVDGDDPVGVTSINVLELAWASDTWNRPGRRSRRTRGGSLDWRAAAGYLIDSSFGEKQRWHVRGGLRWGLPLAPARVAPFLRLEAEAGDVERWSVAAGISPLECWDFSLDHRSDGQFLGRDDDVTQLLARYRF